MLGLLKGTLRCELLHENKSFLRSVYFIQVLIEIPQSGLLFLWL